MGPGKKMVSMMPGRPPNKDGCRTPQYMVVPAVALFDSLKELLPDEPGSPSQAEIAARLGMTENAVRQAFYRFRQRYQTLLRQEIAHTVATPGDIEDELRHLIAVLEA